LKFFNYLRAKKPQNSDRQKGGSLPAKQIEFKRKIQIGKGGIPLLIYLNARVIRNIFEKSIPCGAERFGQILREGGHKLVYSWLNITELSEPLLYSKDKAEPLELLVKIEEMPHVYIHSAGIPRMELESAAKGFGNGGHYAGVQPLVKRFDFTVDGKASPPTGDRPEYPLPEIVWDLYSFGALGGQAGCAEKLRDICMKDRAAASKPAPEKHFTVMLARNLRLFQVPVSADHVPAFAKWVYTEPDRCPAQRLRHEVWQAMVKSSKNDLSLQDWKDFSHLDCLPYVDMIALDKGLGQLVSEVSSVLKRDYASRVVADAKGVLNRL
jgi:hypothetical protein